LKIEALLSIYSVFVESNKGVEKVVYIIYQSLNHNKDKDRAIHSFFLCADHVLTRLGIAASGTNGSSI
jgi:uncharacterized membrane protein